MITRWIAVVLNLLKIIGLLVLFGGCIYLVWFQPDPGSDPQIMREKIATRLIEERFRYDSLALEVWQIAHEEEYQRKLLQLKNKYFGHDEFVADMDSVWQEFYTLRQSHVQISMVNTNREIDVLSDSLHALDSIIALTNSN